jgi:hypothetical protein
VTRSRPLTVEDIPRLVDAIVAALERRGMFPDGKTSHGMENDRCDSLERQFMDPINIATSGESFSVDEVAAKRLSHFRRRQKRAPTRPRSSSRSPGER